MKRHGFLPFARETAVGTALILATTGFAEPAEPPAQVRPNIIFILADDLGIGDVGCFGQTKIKTPNIDRLAAQGTRFTQCYAGSPVCGPSRCSLLTGLHGGHTRVRGNNAFAGGMVEGKARRMSLTSEDITIGNVLQNAGYRTCVVGKWHLEGFNRKATPLDHGFDEMYGWLLFEPTTHEPYYYPARSMLNRDLVDVPGNENGKHGVYETDLYAGYATDFIRRNANASRPFFLYFAPSAPHDPLVAPPDLEPYTNETWENPMKIYAATITRLDGAVGQLVALLEELKIADHTIVIFTSDNGPRSIPTKELTRVVEFFDSNGPLTGYKRDMYEGGIREPTCIYWPGHVPAGRINGAPWYSPDFMPTLAELAGAPAPKKTDGISVVSLLLGKTEKLPERFLYWEFYERGFEQAVQWGQWKAVRHKLDEPIELYNLTEDIAEKNNIAAKNPAVVAQIEAYLKTAHIDSPEFPVDHAVPAAHAHE